MWRPSHQQRPPEASAYEYNARYNMQPTEDSEEAIAATPGTEGGQGAQVQKPAYRPKRPNYRPTPLRWPFIACVAVVLTVLMALVIYARQSMPDSDNTAVIEERTVVVYRLHRRQDGDEDFSELEKLGTPVFTLDSEPDMTAKEGAVASTSTTNPTQTPLPENLQGGLERPGEIELEVPLNPCGSSSVCTTDVTTSVISKTIIEPEKTEVVDVVIGTTSKVVTTEIEQTIVIGGTPTITSETTEEVITSDVTVTKTFVEDVTDVPEPSEFPDGYGEGGPDEGAGAGQTYTGQKPPHTVPLPSTSGKYPPKPGGGGGHHSSAPPFPTNGTTVASSESSESSRPPEDPSSEFTSPDATTDGQESPTTEPLSTPPVGEFPTTTKGFPTTTKGKPPPPSQTTRTETIVTQTTITTTKTTAKPTVTGGTTTVVTKTTTKTEGFPVTSKTPIVAEPTTYFELGPTTIRVTYTPATQGAGAQDQVPVTHFTTSVKPGITVTGTVPGVPVAVVTSVDDVQTRVLQHAPQTIVTRIGGGESTMLVFVTPSPGLNPGVFAGVTMTVVDQVGGTLETIMVQDQPETIITNVDGALTTIVRTPPPRWITTMVGGSLTTFAVTTTPTATDLLSFTVMTTLDGTLTTFVSTPSPTTIVTTISGKLTTFTSTPSASTYTSTIKGTTKTIASIETPTQTGPPVLAKVYDINAAEYFLGKFLPALLAVLLAIPLRVIDLNAKLYQPFYALNLDGGALGSNSMTLHYTGFKGFVTPFTTLFQGHPVPFITTMIVWGSSLLVPLATESLGLKIHGHCKISQIEGCALDLGISPGPTHALVALLALLVTLLLILIFFLRNWETGLHANPWSVAGMASLARSRDARIKSSKMDAIRKEVDEKRYCLGYFRNADGRDEYGIILYDEAGRFLSNDSNDEPNSDHNSDSEDDFVYERDGSGRPRSGSSGETLSRRHVVPFIALSYPWRIAFALILLGLFVLILYYHLTRTVLTNFTRFMDSSSFGVRFLFAGIGVIIIFGWMAFFVSVSIITPYQLMAASPQPPEKSILLSRPTHGLYGVYASIKEGNAFLLLTAFMSLLSEFLPLLLANIPYNLTQTERTHIVCARITLIILGLMILTLLGSLFIRWPHMPVDPRSIAGAMYYVSESRMVADFEGVSRLTREEREGAVKRMGGRYYYGDVNGRDRVGVDVEGRDATGDEQRAEVDTTYRGNEI